ncbi:LexA family transcriptional regulator [Enterococcus faecalis]|nr:LexA family transcriptional regulator [Enterococcus faecalis]
MLESKIVFGKMVDYFRRENNLTMEELGVKLGKTKSTISRWISGERSPKMEEVEQLAELFNTDIETLIFGTNSTNVTIDKIYKKLEPYRKEKVYTFAEEQLHEQETVNNKVIPLVGKSAANPAVLEYGDTDIEQQSFAHVPDNADCAIYIQGDSMEPLIKNGSIVFYKKQCDVENGEIAIVEIDGDGVTCKKLIKDYENERIILRSINKKYDDRVLKSEEIRIIGKVVTPDKD